MLPTRNRKRDAAFLRSKTATAFLGAPSASSRSLRSSQSSSLLPLHRSQTSSAAAMSPKSFAAYSSNQSPMALVGLVGAVFGGALLLYSLGGGSLWSSAATQVGALRVLTWNMAAINNNPFEYWISHDDPVYNKLMADVSAFIKTPGDKDVPVSTVFSDDMFAELKTEMVAAGWDGVDQVEELWKTDYRKRKIISEFVQDGELGKKRLASMPDRVTNTMRTTSGNAMRPTVINCFKGDLSSQAAWWAEWKKFMFATPVVLRGATETTLPREMLKPIKRSKYPSITEAEEAISVRGVCVPLPLRCCCAVAAFFALRTALLPLPSRSPPP